MAKPKLPADSVPQPTGGSFEQLKLVNTHGAEYWSARDLQTLLGYNQWRQFENAITRAITSCEKSGNDPGYHFASAGKMIALGKGGTRQVPDFHLSRFACYLIAQNGDPRKPEIAFAQKYFAIQTRRQELSDTYRRDQERLELREQTKTEFKALSGAAQNAGVQSRMFGIFHDAGYKGLYGGQRGQAEPRMGYGTSSSWLSMAGPFIWRRPTRICEPESAAAPGMRNFFKMVWPGARLAMMRSWRARSLAVAKA